MSEFELFKNLANSNVQLNSNNTNNNNNNTTNGDFLNDFMKQQGDTNYNNNNKDEIDIEIESIQMDGSVDNNNFEDDNLTQITSASRKSEEERIQKDFYLTELRNSNANIGGIDMSTPLSELKFLWQRQKNQEATNTSVNFMKDVAGLYRYRNGE